MSAKSKKRISPRTILIVLLVICIITAAYVLVTSYSGESEDVLTVREVLDRREELITTQEVIKVKGYYTYFDIGIAYITDSLELPGGLPLPPEDKLRVDHTNVENVTLDEGNIYHFTGKLTYDEINPVLPILIANKIEPK